MSEPENNREFMPITHLSGFQGVYKNKGDPSSYLTILLWGLKGLPESNSYNKHDDVKFIEVTASETELKVKAIQNGCSISEKDYLLGKDIKLSGGRIVLNSEFHALSRGGGDVLVGPSYKEISIGIDSAGHAKYRNRDYAAGLVFLLIPAAMKNTEDIRFERISEKPVGYNNCDKTDKK